MTWMHALDTKRFLVGRSAQDGSLTCNRFVFVNDEGLNFYVSLDCLPRLVP